ncbi:FAD-binding oxidoreductase [Candidatus Uhrbacteria bacterium CG10_big_fil_rev_8_21_14_0_10_48_11]|uniref:D-lactate dehydrogenase (cytochrome) n=1 Tax=Candidatus Uhrbacteria bacterium CG10_big_fil_rev_8_21_14_0_10_48_11 TaxID=1975037 RepID=A0A2M8LFG7_9BACT|nr:MAG: FAD-binding oxidoreductase [Candidatus Uhrbacteria bacterium CG10_big_fil_rev_8_21_14_0_10_48_11]
MNGKEIADGIRSCVEGEVRNDEATLIANSTDASLFSVRPAVVVAPKNEKEACSLVSYIAEVRTKGTACSLTARSAGTDMSGGPLTESIVVSFTEHFNAVGEVQGDSVEVAPGVYYRDFEKVTLAKGRLLPSYPASRDLCTVGGMVNNNSGGERSLVYGKTANFVEVLSVVLRDGKVHQFKKITLAELEEKKKETGLGGEIYKKMHELIRSNAALIKKAKPKVSKNSAGYALWDVLDEESGTFDLTRLLVGSQGTLGLTTSIRFRLVQPKAFRRMLVISLKNLDHLPDIIERVLRFHPETFESYDNHTFRVAMKFLPSILRRVLRGNLIIAGLHLIPAAWSIITGGLPALVLLVEFTDDDEAVASKQAKEAEAALADLPIRTRVTGSTAEANAFLTIRRESFDLLRKHVRGMRTAPFIDDFVVPPAVLHEFFPKLHTILESAKFVYTITGHVGDGNFHIIPLMPIHDPRLATLIPDIGGKVYDLVLAYGGSITGEHNDGLIRTPYLEQQFGKEVCALFRQTKEIFDPDTLFNPGKKVDGSLSYALSHLS